MEWVYPSPHQRCKPKQCQNGAGDRPHRQRRLQVARARKDQRSYQEQTRQAEQGPRPGRRQGALLGSSRQTNVASSKNQQLASVRRLSENTKARAAAASQRVRPARCGLAESVPGSAWRRQGGHGGQEDEQACKPVPTVHGPGQAASGGGQRLP